MRRTIRRRSAAAAVCLAIVVGVLATTSEAAYAATAPGAPTGLTVTVGHYGLAELHWNAPATDGGSPLLDYVVNSSPPTDCTPTLFPPQTECGVQYGVTYTFSVAAENAIGAGPASNEVSATPVPMLSIANARVTEGNAGATHLAFVVSLDGPSALPVSVFATTQNRTATTGTDYVRTLGTLNFAPGQTSTTLDVPVNGDTLFEADETMSVALSTPTNAVFRRKVGVGTILNDDTPPTVSIADTAQVEGNNSPPLTHMRFTVSLSALSGAKAKIYWSTAPGTATPGSDYIDAGGTVVIGAGNSSAVIVVPVIPDRLRETDETLFVHIDRADVATLGRATAQGTILNDD